MKLLVALTAVVLLTPALASAQKTSFDYDKAVDLTKFKTYALKDGTKVGDPLVDNRIIAAIEAELTAKGMTKNAATPDMVVVYHVAFDKQKDVTAYSMGGGYGAYGYRWGGGWGTTDVRVTEILIGTLMIDIADQTTNTMVWRGIGVKEVDTQAKAEKRDKNIAGAVKKILANFPPKKKS